jgi:hypothetical protein
MAILATIAGSLAGAFSIGLRILSPTGAQAELIGNHDLLAFEQQIGADVARADCLRSPAVSTPQWIPTGGCTGSVGETPSTCSPAGYFLCLAWYIPGSTTCHTVTYWRRSDGTGIIERSDLFAGTTARIATGGLQVTASWTPTPTSNNGYKWTNQVKVVVTQATISGAPAAVNPPSTTFYLVPLAADPLSPVLPGSSSAC